MKPPGSVAAFERRFEKHCAAGRKVRAADWVAVLALACTVPLIVEPQHDRFRAVVFDVKDGRLQTFEEWAAL